MPSLHYADLGAAWFEERVLGLGAALEDAGWQRLAWCRDADWCPTLWMDPNHPERPMASELLRRMLMQLPVGTRNVLVVGDSTLSQHFRESWEESQIQWNWADRAAFLAESGCPGAIWSIPGAKIDSIVWQLWKALQWEGRRFDAILLCGGWNQRWGDPRELAAALTEAAQS